MKINVAHRK